MQACQQWAREAFYWPSMYKKIEQCISQGHVCNTYQQEKTKKEPMILHPVPARAWQFLEIDLFEF